MPVDPTNTEILRDALTGAKSFSTDGQSAEAHPLGDVVDAVKELDQREAIERKSRGLRFTKISPPGSA